MRKKRQNKQVPQEQFKEAKKQLKQEIYQPHETQNLFHSLELGDRKIENIHQEATIIVGLSRHGKSTSFNWILGKQLKGVSNGPGSVYYQNMVQGKEIAQTSPGDASTTLIPNIAQLDDKTTLLDMAGFLDSRNYVGVMGVSYFLKSVFDRVKKVRFIIVVSESFFTEPRFQNIKKTFQGFFKMFHIKNQFSTQAKQEFFKSVSMIITRAPKLGQNEAAKSCLHKLQESTTNFYDKQLMLDLLDHLIYQNKIINFQQAQQNVFAPPFNYFPLMIKNGWSYLNLKQYQAKYYNSVSIINIPFKQDLKNMSKIDSDKLKEDIQGKINISSQFCHLVQFLIQQLNFRWDKFINEQIEIKQVLNFQSTFQQIQKYLQKIDQYRTKTFLEYIQKQYFKNKKIVRKGLYLPQIQQIHPEISLMGSILTITKIFDLVFDFRNQQIMMLQFSSSMDQYKKMYNNILQQLSYFAQTKNQHELLWRLTFIINRGFHQFKKFYEIDRETIHKAQRQLLDRFTLTGEKLQFIKKYVNSMTPQLLRKLFKNMTQLQQYDGLFGQYVIQMQKIDNSGDNRDQYTFLQGHYNISITKTRVFQQNKQSVEACFSLIQTIKIIISQANNITLESESNIDQTLLIKKKLMQKKNLIKQLANTLNMLDSHKYQKINAAALNLFISNDCYNKACETFQLILKLNQNNLDQLSQTYRNYSMYCFSNKQIQKGIYLLKMKKEVDIQNQNFEQYYNANQVLISIQKEQKSKNESLDQFIAQMNDYESISQNLKNDSTLEIQLQEIENILNHIE